MPRTERGENVNRRIVFLLSALLPLSAFAAYPSAADDDLARSIVVDFPANDVRLYSHNGMALVGAPDGRRWRLAGADGKVLFQAIDNGFDKPIKPADGLPDGVAHSDGAGRTVWLTSPTTRYDHGVLGDAIEAGGLRLSLPEGQLLDFKLGTDEVFEDRYVRFWDVDGAGHDELVVVKSGRRSGARLAAYQVRGGGISLMAEGPAIGQAYRWLNPVGAADFDGDGNIEVAAVITPHLGALLRLYRLAGNRLIPVHEARGFSNHAIGMRTLELSAVADVDGDGISDIIVPNAARNTLRLVTFAQGRFRELGRIAHAANVTGNLVLFEMLDRPAVAYPLANGKMAVALFPRGQVSNGDR